MDLDVSIQKYPHNEIAITEIITPTEHTYVSRTDDYNPLTYRNHFAFDDTCAIDVIFKETSSESKMQCMYITLHEQEESDNTISVVFTVPTDGLYSVNHVVLPNQKWFDSVKDDNLLHEIYTGYIYYIDDGTEIHRVFTADVTRDLKISIEELIDESNQDGTTISIKNFSVFCTHFLEQCYIKACKEFFSNYDKRCPSVDSNVRFNRDFIWMTLNVINYLLDDGRYLEALLILEDLYCYNFCGGNGEVTNKRSGCGCSH